MALTERQQEIQDHLRQGKSAREIAQALGISENAVYQHRRRMRQGGADTGSTRTQSRKASSGGRQSTGTKSDGGDNGDSKAPAAQPVKVVTPERALRDEKNDLERQVKEFDGEVTAAEKALEQARSRRDNGVAKISERLANVSAALNALTGAQAPAPAQAPPETDEATDAAQAPQEAPQAAKSSGKPASTPRKSGAKAATTNGKPADAPKAEATGDDSKAEADAAQAAAEQPDAEAAAA